MTPENKKLAHREAIDWAISIRNNPDVLYLDMETNGLPTEDKNMVDIIQLCFLNQDRTTVLNSIMKTPYPLGRRVESLTGLTWRELNNSGITFKALAPIVSRVIKNKHLVSYNSEFDITQLKLNLEAAKKPTNFSYDCAMLQYSKYCGVWSTRKNDWKWMTLPKIGGNAHNAEGDTRSLYDLVVLMSEDRKIGEDLDFNLDF